MNSNYSETAISNFGLDSFSKTKYKKQSSQQFAGLQLKEIGFHLKKKQICIAHRALVINTILNNNKTLFAFFSTKLHNNALTTDMSTIELCIEIDKF